MSYTMTDTEYRAEAVERLGESLAELAKDNGPLDLAIADADRLGLHDLSTILEAVYAAAVKGVPPVAPATLDEARARLEDLAEGLDGMHESYGDMSAEHAGETARFGDSWPGARIHLRDMRRAIDRAEAEVAAIHAAYPVLRPAAPDHLLPIGPPNPDDPEPF